jgi:predicted transcriptional regulator of viral defense system
MLAEEISRLAAQGRSCFSFEELAKRVDSSPTALKAALRRLVKKGEIAMPFRGFYIIVPPEYRIMGCLPAEQFVPDLMDHLGEVYYAGLLTAAEYHGAAHHRPQTFQVVVGKARRPIRCGRVQVEFVVRRNAQVIPIQSRNTPAGILKLSTSEATALDLIGYANHCGGLDNVATVLAELAEKIDPDQLLQIANLSPIAWVQRLGYLLEVVGEEKSSSKIAEYLRSKQPVPVPLVPAVAIKGARKDNRWQVFVNAEVEAEI